MYFIKINTLVKLKVVDIDLHKMAYCWFDLGILLRVPLELVKQGFQQIYECSKELFLWIDREKSTWMKVVRALVELAYWIAQECGKFCVFTL